MSGLPCEASSLLQAEADKKLEMDGTGENMEIIVVVFLTFFLKVSVTHSFYDFCQWKKLYLYIGCICVLQSKNRCLFHSLILDI